jgi:diguanylate cyclase (GGDEF)-like protein
VVVIGMETSQLPSFYSLFGFSLAPTISIFKGDGGIVARHPGMEKLVGKSNAKSEIFTTYLLRAPFGNYKSHSRLDGKTRLAAYRSLPDLDLVIFSGIETPAVFAAWKARSLRLLTIVGGMLALIWGALLAASRATAEQAVLRQKNRHLDTLASRDPLTGIGNRRLFARALKRDWSKHARSGAPISLAILDVDYFKLFNDHYGHQAGDDCLRRVAHALQESLQREGDLVARYGGEEFVAVLDCGHEGALHMAERMRRQVESLEIPHVRSKASAFVTASFGVASTENTRAQSAEELLALADKALYEAKANGRNQICALEASSLVSEVKMGA